MSRSLVQFSHLLKSFGSLTLFEDISLSINEGDIFALIGENGSGKTTLFQLLIGQVMPDSGSLNRSPDLTIGYLPQEIEVSHPEMLVRDYIEEGPLTNLEKEMAASLENSDLTKWALLHEEFEKLGGYRRLPLEKVLRGLKLDNSLLDRPIGVLSSGQRVIVALAKALNNDPDLLLLDEPTNHLDKEMQSWLQETLRFRKGATVIISHDRKFLNESCNLLIEIKKRKLVRYGGSYDFYLAEQGRLAEKELEAYHLQQEELFEIKQKIKALTFSKGKPPPPKDRNIMAYDKRGAQHQKSVQRTLNELKGRLEEIEAHLLPHPKPKTIKGLRFFPMPLGSQVAIECEHISKRFGSKTLFNDFSRSLSKNERIILTGPNGSGKTTLLRCLLGEIEVDSGKIRRAPTARIAYLDQEVERVPLDQTPVQYFENRFSLTEEDLRCELHKAAIGGAELLNRPFSSLSVSQRKRLMLLTIVLEKPNVLFLDEPTNHLDFMTLEAFEKALLEFEGAILAVSHDETFIAKIATGIWEV